MKIFKCLIAASLAATTLTTDFANAAETKSAEQSASAPPLCGRLPRTLTKTMLEQKNPMCKIQTVKYEGQEYAVAIADWGVGGVPYAQIGIYQPGTNGVFHLFLATDCSASVDKPIVDNRTGLLELREAAPRGSGPLVLAYSLKTRPVNQPGR